MPRQARRKSSTGIYHIVLRGINRQNIFDDCEDKIKFIEILKECKLVSKYRIFAYCIMSNHVHLLLKIEKEELEQIFRRIGARYVYWYNKKYDRCGHLFQDRFESEAVEDDAYLLTVLRYIIQNPQKAGITDGLEEYEWSSHKDYLGRKGITDTGYILSIISDDGKRQVKIYKNYINKENEDQCLDIEIKKKRITDDELYILIEDRFHIKPQMIQNESREKMREIIKEILKIDGVSTRQLARVTGVSANIIWRL